MLPVRASVDLGCYGNEGVLHVPLSSRITETSPSDCLVSFQDIRYEVGSYFPAEMELVYSSVPADCV